jgi:hypothetical protein
MAEYTQMSLAVGRNMAQPVSRLSLTAATLAQSPSRARGICGEQSDTDRGFTQSTISITILTLPLTHF